MHNASKHIISKVRKLVLPMLAAQEVSSLSRGQRLLHPDFHLNPVIVRLMSLDVDFYLFGGVVRDALLEGPSARPRDVDIVVDLESNIVLREIFKDVPVTHTRYGGVRYFNELQFDIWALPDTWAVREGHASPSFESLPHTTFLNVEAIVVQLNNLQSEPQIFENGFLDSLKTRMLDINLEVNPFPALCVIRSLVLAWKLEFTFSIRLAEYIVRESDRCGVEELIRMQISHYGNILFGKTTLIQWLNDIRIQLEDRVAGSSLRSSERIDLLKVFGGVSGVLGRKERHRKYSEAAPRQSRLFDKGTKPQSTSGDILSPPLQ